MNIVDLRDALARQAEEAKSDAVTDRMAKVHSRVRRIRRRRQVGGTSIAVAAMVLSAVLVPQLIGGPAPTSPGEGAPAASPEPGREGCDPPADMAFDIDSPENGYVRLTCTPEEMKRLFDSDLPVYFLDKVQGESVVLDDETRSLTFDVPASDKPRNLIAGLRADLLSLAESDGSIEVYVDGHPVPFTVRHAVRPAPSGGLERYKQVGFIVLEPGPHEIEVVETDESRVGVLQANVYELRRD